MEEFSSGVTVIFTEGFPMDKEMTASEETPAAEIACARSSILYFLLFDGFVRGMFEDVRFLSPTLLLGGGGISA